MENKYNYKALSKQELEKNFIQMKNNISEARETIILQQIQHILIQIITYFYTNFNFIILLFSSLLCQIHFYLFGY